MMTKLFTLFDAMFIMIIMIIYDYRELRRVRRAVPLRLPRGARGSARGKGAAAWEGRQRHVAWTVQPLEGYCGAAFEAAVVREHFYFS
tara:strand:- start:242 stop:505 length:264 start_codon:yes stop_codon:yes gene_type:complete